MMLMDDWFYILYASGMTIIVSTIITAVVIAIGNWNIFIDFLFEEQRISVVVNVKQLGVSAPINCSFNLTFGLFSRKECLKLILILVPLQAPVFLLTELIANPTDDWNTANAGSKHFLAGLNAGFCKRLAQRSQAQVSRFNSGKTKQFCCFY